MFGSRPSYRGEAAERQSPPFFRTAVLAVTALGLAGCAGMGLPFGGPSNETTGSIAAPPPPKPVKTADAVNPSDWQTVNEALSGMAGAGDVDWRNPSTGSAGTVTAFAPEDRAGRLCRSFRTTISDMRGVRLYRGEACRTGGSWKLTGVAPDDGTLL